MTVVLSDDISAFVCGLRSLNVTIEKCVLMLNVDDTDDYVIKSSFPVPRPATTLLKELVLAMRPHLRPGARASRESDDLLLMVWRRSSNEFVVKFETIKPLPMPPHARDVAELRDTRAFFTKRAVEAARAAADPPRAAAAPPPVAAAVPADCEDPCVPDYSNMEELN